MSINELWSVLSHGALKQFDPEAEAEELVVEDYDKIIDNAVLVAEYTLKVGHTPPNASAQAARVLEQCLDVIS